MARRYPGLGAAGRVEAETAGVRVWAGGAEVVVQVLAEDLARVRLIPPGVRRRLASPAVIKQDWAPPEVTLGEDEEAVELTTPALRVRLDKASLRVTFRRPDGTLINRDHPSAGMGWRGSSVFCRKELLPGEHFYGLGEKMGALDKRGRVWTLWNTDVCPHLPSTDPLYVSIPLLIGLRNGQAHGLFFDNTFRSRFDLGRRSGRWYTYEADGGELDYYFFAGPGLKDILRRYTELTGRTPLPPLWALGYHQCRYSYYPQAEVERVAAEFRRRDIPCDALYLDIHHMDGYRVFTFDPRRFPDPAGLARRLAEQGFKLVSIVDPGVKADPEYRIYREGTERGYWVRGPQGEPVVRRVWPGKAVFPDFLREEVRRWWAGCHEVLFDAGIAGVWNDMNEPASFGVPSRTLPLNARHGEPDEVLDHSEVHNAYANFMAEATRAAFAAGRPGERPFVITRAGYAGIQRHAAVWTGDNSSWWEHLLQSIPMLLNLGLSGVPLVGADVGGFLDEADGELVARWTQLGACTPLFRNHSALDSRRQEPFAFGPDIEAICRKYIKLRYRLLPYLYTLLYEAATEGFPPLRPLVLEFPGDERTHRLFDQFLLGPDLLVAPVYLPGAESRSVYFPEGAWADYWTGRIHAGGRAVTVEAPLDVLPLYLRRGAILPHGPAMNFTGERPPAVELLDVYPTERGSGSSALYLDDGRTLDYQTGRCGFLRFAYADTVEDLTLTARTEGDGYPGDLPLGVVRLSGQEAPPLRVSVQRRAQGSAGFEEALPQVADREALLQGGRGWCFATREGRLYIGFHGLANGSTIKVVKA